MSCVLITSFAASADEITMVGTWPSCKYIIGPYLADKFLRAIWGREPTKWCMLPRRGNFQGPGGRFIVAFLDLDQLLSFRNINVNRKKEIKNCKDGNSKSIFSATGIGWFVLGLKYHPIFYMRMQLE